MVLVSVMAVACASGVIWGFQRADSVLTKVAAGTQGMTSDVVAVRRITERDGALRVPSLDTMRARS